MKVLPTQDQQNHKKIREENEMKRERCNKQKFVSMDETVGNGHVNIDLKRIAPCFWDPPPPPPTLPQPNILL